MSANEFLETTKSLYSEIGRTVVAFQRTEFHVADSLAIVLRLKELDSRHMLMAAMSYKQKVELLMALLSRNDPGLTAIASLESIRSALFLAEEFRNRIVHSLWTVDGSEDLRWIQVKASIKSRVGLSVKTLDAASQDLKTANDALDAICNCMFVPDKRLQEVRDTLHEFLNRHL